MINKKHIEDLVASKVLASAIVAQFSGVSIIEARDDTYGFSCYFRSNQPIHPDLFPYLEQTIKQILDSGKIKSQEMVRDVAVNYLKHKGFKKRAEELKEAQQNQLFTVLDIAGYVDAIEEEINLEDIMLKLKHFKVIQLESIDSPEMSTSSRHFLLKAVCEKDSSALKQRLKSIKEAKACYHLELMQKRSFLEKHGDVCILMPKGIGLKKELQNKLETLLDSHQFNQIEFLCELESFVLDELAFSKTFPLEKKPYFFHTTTTELASLEQDLGLYSLEKNQSITFLDKADVVKDLGAIEQMILLIDSLFKILSLEYTISFNPYIEREKKQIDALGAFSECLKKLNFEDKLACDFAEKSFKGAECQMVFSVIDGFGRSWDLVFLEIRGKKQRFYLEGKLLSFERLIAVLQDVNKIFL